ncbi:hypothetical protein BSFP_035850 [Burkholderia stabilis]|uniref:Uncharacterized protein n=1 Tax=Burkholderia stabilis TaxID=95485 RepID=A0A1Y1BLI7_9BURK|nr:hypothetical protein BSFP_035850 [Burkholderia stabilis]
MRRSGRRAVPPATENLYRAGNPLVQDIVTHWGEWRDGVPRR